MGKSCFVELGVSYGNNLGCWGHCPAASWPARHTRAVAAEPAGTRPRRLPRRIPDSGRIGADGGNEIDVEFRLWNWIYRHVPPSTWNDGAGQEITITDCSFVPQRPW